MRRHCLSLTLTVIVICSGLLGAGCKQMLERLNKNAAGLPQHTMVKASTPQPLPIDPIASAASQGPFGGITIIELQDPIGAAQLDPWGKPDMLVNRPSYVVVFLAPEGSYASLTDVEGRTCFSWLTEARSSDTLVFAVDTGGMKDPTLRICRPFTLHLENPSTVHVESGNYSRSRRILSHVAPTTPEWNLEAIQKLDVNGIRLGPVESAVSRVSPQGKPKVFVSTGGNEALRQFQATFPMTKPGQRYGEVVHGYVAGRRHTNWPSDVLFQAWYQESFVQPATVEAFDAVLMDRYGPPSVQGLSNSLGASKDILMQWFYDLNGRQLAERDATNSSCLAVRPAFTERSRDFPLFFNADRLDMGDIGPWGCSVLMTVSRPNYSKSMGVSGYRLDAVQGLAMGISHFKSRLGEVRQAKEKLRTTREFQPKL